MFNEFVERASRIYERARVGGRLIKNPSNEELRHLSLKQPGVKATKYGSLTADSEPNSRSAQHTRNSIDSKFGEEELEFLEKTEASLALERIIAIDVQVGDGHGGVTARLILPERFAHLAYGGMKLFKPVVSRNPTYQVIMFTDEEFENNKARKLPDKKIKIRLAHSPDGRLVKVDCNGIYLGEWKKGVFAGEDWRAKQSGKAIFLHAGCRQDYLERSRGDYWIQNSLFIALSANGKTSLTCKVLARKEEEKSWLVQDDGGTLSMDGSFKGFEAGGLFIKTEKLSPLDQLESYYACLKPESFLENVWVNGNGEIDFFNLSKTANGRAVVERRDFMHASNDINVDMIHNLFLITRGNTIPAISRLTPEQATAFMVLGQSMQSSAGDPTQAGRIINEFFYDPFIAGDRAEHANLFFDILRSNPHITCYLLNTGGIGEGERYTDIRLQDTLGILDSVLRGALENWVESDATGLTIPKSMRMADSVLVHPEKLYSASEFQERETALRRQRIEELAKYPHLDRKIIAAFQN